MSPSRPLSGAHVPVETLRAVLLRAAYDLLAAVEGQPVLPVEVVINDHHGMAVAICSMPGELQLLPPTAPNLKPMERRLLQVATHEPMLAKQLGRLAGYRSLPHVYEALSRLRELGLIEKTSRGYRLPQ